MPGEYSQDMLDFINGGGDNSVPSGSRLPTSNPSMEMQAFIKNAENEEKYGPSVANALKAGALGFGETATFGLSNKALVSSGMVNPETISELEERNKGAHIAGNILGIAVPLALAPEAGGVAAASAALKTAKAVGTVEEIASASKALMAAKSALTAADILNPVSAAAKLGSQTSQAAKVLGMSSELGSKALGLATEGALYGVGNTINESALGDPGLAGEHLMSNVGYGALWGAGAGAFMHGLGKAASKAGQGIANIASDVKMKMGIPMSDVDVLSELIPTSRNEIARGLKEKIPEAASVEAVKDLGLPILPGMTSANKAARKGLGLLLNSGTTMAKSVVQSAEQGIQRAKDLVTGIVKTEAPESVIELGSTLKPILNGSFQKELEPVAQLWDRIHQTTDSVPVPKGSLTRVANNILDIEGLKTSLGGEPLSKSSPQWKLAENVAEEIRILSSAEDIQNYRRILRERTSGIADTAVKRIAGIIQDKLADLEESSLINHARKHFTADSPIGKEILDIADSIPEAKRLYAELRNKFDPIAEMTGKKRVYGPRDFIDHLTDIDEQKLAKNLLNKSNTAQFLEFERNFPEAAKVIIDFKKNQLLARATQKNGLNVEALYKLVMDEKVTPKEIRKLMFSAEEIQNMKNIAEWRKNIPFLESNPSLTSYSTDTIGAFTHPIKWLTNNVRDAAILGGLKGIEGADATVLMQIEKSIVKNTNAIFNGVKDIFSGPGGTSIERGILGAAIYSDHDKFQKFTNRLHELNSNPQAAIDATNEITGNLHGIAPRVASSMASTVVRGLQILGQAAPQIPKDPLGAAYEPSATEKEQFHRTLEVIENPVIILKQVRSGVLTPEGLNAFVQHNPKMYQQMRAEIMDQMVKLKPEQINKMSFATKQSLSMFLGQPMDSALLPQTVLRYQQSHASAAQQKAAAQQPIKMRSSAKLGVGDRMSLRPKD